MTYNDLVRLGTTLKG